MLEAAQAMRVNDQIRILTPARFQVTTVEPFQLTFATDEPGEQIRLVVEPDSLRELRITGNRVVIGRSTTGERIELRSPNQIELRSIPTSEPRP